MYTYYVNIKYYTVDDISSPFLLQVTVLKEKYGIREWTIRTEHITPDCVQDNLGIPYSVYVESAISIADFIKEWNKFVELMSKIYVFSEKTNQVLSQYVDTRSHWFITVAKCISMFTVLRVNKYLIRHNIKSKSMLLKLLHLLHFEDVVTSSDTSGTNRVTSLQLFQRKLLQTSYITVNNKLYLKYNMLFFSTVLELIDSAASTIYASPHYAENNIVWKSPTVYSYGWLPQLFIEITPDKERTCKTGNGRMSVLTTFTWKGKTIQRKYRHPIKGVLKKINILNYIVALNEFIDWAVKE